MHKTSEQIKIDMGVVPQVFNNTNKTGKYHSVKEWLKIFAVLMTGNLAATKTAKLELYEAEDADGTSAALLSGASATITSNSLVTECTVDLSSAASTDVVEVNGIEFTMGASTIVASREFADDDGLASCINDATYGVEGLSASATGDVVTLISDEPGEYTITTDKTENAGTITLVTQKALAYVEIGNMDLSGDNTHIACKVTVTDSSGNNYSSALLIRDYGRKAVSQKVGAGTVV